MKRCFGLAKTTVLLALGRPMTRGSIAAGRIAIKTGPALFLLSLVSMAAGAATITLNCADYPTTLQIGAPSDVQCGLFEVPGGTLTGVTLLETATYSGAGAGGAGVTFDLSFDNSSFVSPVSWSAGLSGVSGNNSSGSNSRSQTALSGVTNANFANFFDLSIRPDLSFGNPSQITASIQVQYTYTPDATVPEPSTAGALGLGLFVLGMIADIA